MISPITRMTSACSSAGDRSSRFPGGDMPLQNLKSLYAESSDLPIFTRAVSPCPPTAAASKTSAARTFAPITFFKDLLAADWLQNFWTICRAQPRIVLLPPEIRPTSCPDLQADLESDLLFGQSRAGKEETMREKLTGPRGSRAIWAARREPRLRYPARRRRNRWTVVIP